MKKIIVNPHLKTWVLLNLFLMTADEKACKNLFDLEMKGRKRAAFLKRIHSRLNRVRADRERTELQAKLP